MNDRLELRFALAEGDAVEAGPDLRGRILAAATAERAAGRSIAPPAWISGADAFGRVVGRLGALLADLEPGEWSAGAKGYTEVQQLIGHLVGVEDAFLAVLAGEEDPGAGIDHRAMTEPAIVGQHGRATADTLGDWTARTAASVAAVAALDPARPVTFYGASLALDELLVLRAFEMWIHDEDIRRATGRPLADPDPETLGRMVEVAIGLLPTGIALAERQRPGCAARLVLTGPGGGTWDVNLDGTDEARRADASVVVDAAWFCRVIGDREDVATSGAIVAGEADLVTDLFVGAAALALD